jgi:hypothetical protein
LGQALNSYCSSIENGISTSYDKVYFVKNDEVKKLDLEGSLLRPCIKGRDVVSFRITDPTYSIIYIRDEDELIENPKIRKYLEGNKATLIKKCVEKKKGKKPRNWSVLFRSRKPKIFESRKLVFRQTGDSVICSVDHSGVYCLDSVNVGPFNDNITHDIEQFLVACLNSKVVKYYYRVISQELGRQLAQVKPSRLKQIPIPTANEVDKTRLGELAEACAEAVKRDDQDRLSTLKAEIDHVVYRLFNLKPDDIQVIEEACP